MPRCIRFLSFVLSLSVLIVISAAPVRAQGLLRDAGIEHGLNILARPILIAAGLPSNGTRVLVVNSLTLNAFVADSRTVFVNAGLILALDSADELQAVIAHEVAHIANGHFARRGLNLQSSRTATGLGILLGLAAGAATGNPEAAVGIAVGSASSAQRVFLAHTRAEEAAADRSGMRYMARAGIDPEALRGVLNLFAGQEELSRSRQDPYAVSHPLTRDRLRAIELHASALAPRTSDRAQADYWFDRVKAKLSSYLRSPGYTLNRIKSGDNSDAALIGQTMAYFKTPDLNRARGTMAALLERKPEDAYFHELSGWIELESGKVDPSIAAYAKAAELSPNEPLILAGYGRALLAKGTPETNKRALEVLQKSRARDGTNSFLLRDLALAYAKDGQNGMASLSTAERYALQGSLEDAEIHAHRASGQLPTGSPGWSRAQDIIHAAEREKKKRR